MKYLKFNQETTISIDGTGPLYRDLLDYYHDILMRNQTKDIDIYCKILDISPDPDYVLGDEFEYYGVENEKFIVQQSESTAVINVKKNLIQFEKNSSRGFASDIIEFFVRYKMIQGNPFVLTHGSSIKYNGKTFIFPAWKYTGKTNIVLSLLERDSDAMFLGDDRVWIGENSSILSLPVSMKLLPHNTSVSSKLVENSTINQIELSMYNWINNNTIKKRNTLELALRFIGEYYLKPDGIQRSPSELFGSNRLCEKESLDCIIILQSNRKSDRVSASEINNQTAMQYLTTINEYEWNKGLRTISTTYETLTGDKSLNKMLSKICDQESKVFLKAVENTPTYRIEVPRETKWEKIGIPEMIADKVDRISKSI